MQNLDQQVIAQSLDWVAGEPVWLCTVLSTYGSSPRAPGAMMVINAAGLYCGSLSGGCVEEDFISRIRAGEFRQGSQIVRYGDGGLPPNRTLPCGGKLDILIEMLPAGPGSAGYLSRLGQALSGYLSLRKEVILPHACRYLEACAYSGATLAGYEGNRVSLTIAAAPRLIIAGLSTVALYCAEFSIALGFETIVCDNRPDALQNFAPQLHKDVIVKETFPARYLEQAGCHGNTAVVALTHDPRVDDLTMMEAVNTDSFYLGVMGSVRNSRQRLQRLETIGGLSTAQLARIHAPVGMDLGSKTPAEIALAVMADIVRHKNRH
ncbi:XdhC family protein [Sodalis ligni]|uniref:Xanthine dehydrogenase accessory factor n=1 Tax=Sodalis ligni TaxID=2697027 RepID=A0A4R1NE84_9GAMM|nr:XdhC family protein [Sodalis ligni]TCL02936.1 xanthine dehydrogenase accessory factor [Sodalis ligni]